MTRGISMVKMWGLLRIQRNIFRRPLYRIVPAPFVNRRLAHGEKEPYTEGPNGFLFNEKPLLPGERREWEAWEGVFYYGVLANLIAILVVLKFKPKNNLKEWVHAEAVKRVEARKAADEH